MVTLSYDAAGPVLRSGEVDIPDFEVVRTLNSSEATGGEAVFLDSVVVVVTPAATWAEYAVNGNLETDLVLTFAEGGDKSQLIGNTVVPVGSGGYFAVRVSTDGLTGALASGNTTLEGGVTFTNLARFVPGSIADQLAGILDYIVEGKTRTYYTNYNKYGSNPSPALDPDCVVAGMDLSGIPITTTIKGRPGHENRGCLITQQHLVGAAHWGTQDGIYAGYSVGNTIVFRGVDGTLHYRTVVGVSREHGPNGEDTGRGGGDVCIATLDSPLPSSVKSYKVMGDWLYREQEYYDERSTLAYDAAVAFWMDQNWEFGFCPTRGIISKWTTAKGSQVLSGETINYSVGTFGLTFAYLELSDLRQLPLDISGGRSGDSGSALFILVENDPCVCGTFWSPLGSNFLGKANGAFVNRMIKDADIEANITTGAATEPGGAGTLEVVMAPELTA